MHCSSLPLHFYLASNLLFSSRLCCTLQLSLASKTGCIEVRLGCNARLVGPMTVHSSAWRVTLQCRTSVGITVPVQLSRQAVPLTSGTLARLKHGIRRCVTSDQHHLISSPYRLCYTSLRSESVWLLPYSAFRLIQRNTPGTCSRVCLDRPRATIKDLTRINESTNNTRRRWRPEIHKGRIRYVLAMPISKPLPPRDRGTARTWDGQKLPADW
jgi:hypothetical protein